MSSPVHAARCTRVDGTIVEIELEPTTATAAHFPISRFFALALLFESATETTYSEPGVPWRREFVPALAEVTTFDEMLDLAGLEKPEARKEALTNRIVRSAAYVATRNWQPSLWRFDPARGFVDPGERRGEPAWRRAQEALDAAFERAIAGVDVTDWDALAAAIDAGPHATMRIEVTDARWCEHLEVGMIWDVYAFDYGAALLG